MPQPVIRSGENGAIARVTSNPAQPVLDPIAAARLARVDPAWAWAAFEPSSDRPWTLAPAAHLFRRAGFGADGNQLQRVLTRGPRATLDDLLNPADGAETFNATFDGHEAAAARSGDASSFNAWWLRRLVSSPDPLGEKLTLFWHNHFAISSAAAADLPLFQRHLQLLRARARGDFDALLQALLNDPAMFVALGGDQNRRSHPNLPFARPWLQAFTVGADAATDRDVAELARCFTGWFVYGGTLRFIEREHDAGEKCLFGRTGPFGRDDLAAILSAHPATVRNLARKLFRWFVSEAVSPGDALLEPLATGLRRREGLRNVVELILRSNLFFSEHALRQKIKSPVELAVGLARSFEASPPTVPMARDLVSLGQRLDEPPTVGGWTGGVDWINTITIASRLKMCRSMLDGSDGYGNPLDPTQAASRHGHTNPSAAAQFWMDVLLQDQLPSASRREILERAAGSSPSPAALREVVATLVSLPEFQLG
jgi:uncharacterized protein (DUF1800 family)